MGTEEVEHLSVKSGSKALEDILEDSIGSTSQLGHGVLEVSKSAALLELDDVLVGDELTAGLKKRSGLRALLNGGSAEGERKNGEKNRQTHIGYCLRVKKKGLLWKRCWC